MTAPRILDYWGALALQAIVGVISPVFTDGRFPAWLGPIFQAIWAAMRDQSDVMFLDRGSEHAMQAFMLPIFPPCAEQHLSSETQWHERAGFQPSFDAVHRAHP